jgi:hypothetical protein
MVVTGCVKVDLQSEDGGKGGLEKKVEPSKFCADRPPSFPENLYSELFINLLLSTRQDKVKCQ